MNHVAAAAAAKPLQSCPTLCDPTDGSPPGSPPSLRFSQQEHWSGLPFPSPMQESEKWKWRHSIVSDSSWPHGLQPTRLLRPWDFPGKNTGVGCHFLLQCRKVKSEREDARSCPTLSDSMYCSPPGSSALGFPRQEYWSGAPSPSLASLAQCCVCHKSAVTWLHFALYLQLCWCHTEGERTSKLCPDS